jgi:hypothetical protein
LVIQTRECVLPNCKGGCRVILVVANANVEPAKCKTLLHVSLKVTPEQVGTDFSFGCSFGKTKLAQLWHYAQLWQELLQPARPARRTSGLVT